MAAGDFAKVAVKLTTAESCIDCLLQNNAKEINTKDFGEALAEQEQNKRRSKNKKHHQNPTNRKGSIKQEQKQKTEQNKKTEKNKKHHQNPTNRKGSIS